MRRFEPGTSMLETSSFSTARTTPSFVQRPSAMPLFSIAFCAYSTWNIRPSGLYVDGE